MISVLGDDNGLNIPTYIPNVESRPMFFIDTNIIINSYVPVTRILTNTIICLSLVTRA